MKTKEPNNRIENLLSEFESLGDIQPSEKWNKALMDRIALARPRTASQGIPVNRYLLVLAFLILVNISLIWGVMRNSKQQTPQQNDELQVISKELLINPGSLNN